MAFPRINGLRGMELGIAGTPLRTELVDLVLSGAKTATAGLATEYEREGEPLEHVGERLALVGPDGDGVGVIVITRVEVVRFDDVTWEFAQAEGEGFTDLEHWRSGHRRYFKREHDLDIKGTEPMVCLWFRLETPT
jgi:uncharacterized protein YhfF